MVGHVNETYQITGGTGRFEGVAQHEDKNWASKIFLGHRDASEATIKLINARTGDVVYAYAVHKKNSMRANQSTAEACAKHLKKIGPQVIVASTSMNRSFMKKAFCAFLISFVPITASAEGVVVRAVEASFNTIQAPPRQDASLLDTVKAGTMSFTHKHALRHPMSASVTPSDRMFPQVSTGGGWDTVIACWSISA